MAIVLCLDVVSALEIESMNNTSSLPSSVEVGWLIMARAVKHLWSPTSSHLRRCKRPTSFHQPCPTQIEPLILESHHNESAVSLETFEQREVDWTNIEKLIGRPRP